MDARYPLYALGLVVAAPAVAALAIAATLDEMGVTPWPWWGLWLAGDLALTAVCWAGVGILTLLGRLHRSDTAEVAEPPHA